jgi:hypothetical protein
MSVDDQARRPEAPKTPRPSVAVAPASPETVDSTVRIQHMPPVVGAPEGRREIPNSDDLDPTAVIAAPAAAPIRGTGPRPTPWWEQGPTGLAPGPVRRAAGPPFPVPGPRPIPPGVSRSERSPQWPGKGPHPNGLNRPTGYPGAPTWGTPPRWSPATGPRMPAGGAGADWSHLWPGVDAFRIAAPRPVPRPIQLSFVLWMTVAGLTVASAVMQMIRIVSGGDSAGFGLVVFNLLFGLVVAVGAAHLRLGHAWARVVNTVIGVFLGIGLLWLLFPLLVIMALVVGVSSAGFAGGGAVLLMFGMLVLFSIASLGFIATAVGFMYRAESNAFLAGRR